MNESRIIWTSGSLEVGPEPRFLGQSGMLLSTEIKCKGALRVRWTSFLKVASYQSNALFKYVSPILSKHSAFESVLRSYDFQLALRLLR